MEKVKIPACPYNPTWGALGTVAPGSISWVSCRDQFQGISNPVGYMSFVFYTAGHEDDVIEFMRTVEQIIGLPDEHALKINKTSVKDVIQVVMSPWWKYRVRRSLLTALLRCGISYQKHTGDGFVKALYSTDYTKHTRAAIDRFFSGYTACKVKQGNNFGGWQNLFSSKDNAEKYLVKLRKKKPVEQENGTN